MNAMSDYRTVYIRSVLPPKPERPAPVGFTMEQLQADAKAAQKRLHQTWNQSVDVRPTSSIRKSHWTAERVAALESDIRKLLRREGPMSAYEISRLLRATHNRHKLRETLTAMKRAGCITSRQASNKRHEWSLA